MAQSPYRERILDHFQNPRHRGRLERPDLVGEADSPVCGDVVRIELQLDEAGHIAHVAFDGEGCVIAMAAASMLSDHIRGRGVAGLRGMADQDMLEMVGVALSRTRTQCALLSLRALEKALAAGAARRDNSS